MATSMHISLPQNICRRWKSREDGDYVAKKALLQRSNIRGCNDQENNLDLRKVKKLIELFEESQLIEMEISEGESTIRLNRGGPVSSAAMQYAPPAAVSLQSAPLSIAPEHAAEGEVETGSKITSPMVGTFYDASSPDSEPYVKVGSIVKVGDVLCIIEAMKTFNQFEAEESGTIRAVYKQTGDPVEFGEPLFLID